MPQQTDRDRAVEETILEAAAADINVPWVYRWTKISHYYGDTARHLLVTAAVLMLVGAPFYADDLAAELPFIVVATVALVSIAAFTSPLKSLSIVADTVVSAIGLTVYEIWALKGYSEGLFPQFAMREGLAVLFLFALYFSAKTLRGMMLKQVGRPDSSEDFGGDQKNISPDIKAAQRRQKMQELLDEINERQKREFED